MVPRAPHVWFTCILHPLSPGHHSARGAEAGRSTDTAILVHARDGVYISDTWYPKLSGTDPGLRSERSWNAFLAPPVRNVPGRPGAQVRPKVTTWCRSRWCGPEMPFSSPSFWRGSFPKRSRSIFGGMGVDFQWNLRFHGVKSQKFSRLRRLGGSRPPDPSPFGTFLLPGKLSW